jgi:colanic acid/amylovoran biosynthesis protein
MTRVLVLWADSRSANLGVRVLAEGMASLARMAWGSDATVDFQDFGPGDSAIGFGGRNIIRDIGRDDGPIASKLRQYDVVLDSGAGDSFASIYGPKRLAIMRYSQRRAARLSVPLILGPQTIGPFESPLSRSVGAATLRDARQVHARDHVSQQKAAELGGMALLSTDVVFALPNPEPARKRDVIVNVSGLLWNSDAHGSASAYRRQVIELVNGLISRGRDVSLLAHVLDNPTSDNDVPAVRAAAAAVGDRVEVVVPHDLPHARSILANAELVIGSRMHACLNALSTGTTAIPWAYSRKFAPLMNDLGWHHTIELRTEPRPADATLRILDRDPGRLSAATLRDTARARLKGTAEAMRRSLESAVTEGNHA